MSSPLQLNDMVLPHKVFQKMIENHFHSFGLERKDDDDHTISADEAKQPADEAKQDVPADAG